MGSLLRQLNHSLAADEILVVDAGVEISDMQAAGIERYVLRLDTNFTAYRNQAVPYTGQGASRSMVRRSVHWLAVARESGLPQ